MTLQKEIVALAQHDDYGVVSSHHYESCILLVFLGGKAELGGGGEAGSRWFLQEQVGNVPEAAEVLWQIHGEESKGAICSGLSEELLVVSMPLPLQS